MTRCLEIHNTESRFVIRPLHILVAGVYGAPFRPETKFTRLGSEGVKKRAKKDIVKSLIVQELCESRGGRPGLSVLTSLVGGFGGRKELLNRASALVTTCHNHVK